MPCPFPDGMGFKVCNGISLWQDHVREEVLVEAPRVRRKRMQNGQEDVGGNDKNIISSFDVKPE